MVTNGDLAPGRRVSRLKLARRIGCSPIPVVEAMRRLESDGLLVKEPRKMARVRKLSPKDIEGLYLAREGLESASAKLCAKYITEPQKAELRKLGSEFENFVKTEDRTQAKEADVRIHRFIAHCASSPLIEQEMKRLHLIELTAGGDPNHWVDPTILALRHRAIIEAICDHDGDTAAYLMRKHVMLGYTKA